VCEIYVAHRRFSADFLATATDMRERSRGFALIYEHRADLVRSLNAEHATRAYTRARAPLVSILHVRVPTHGDVSIENTQPFSDRKYVFAHNGVLGSVYHVLSAMYYPRLRGASDSRLLWEVVKRLPWDRAVTMLRSLGDRFVLADLRRRRIALIGSWAWDEKRGVWDRGSRDSVFAYRYVLLEYSRRNLRILEGERDPLPRVYRDCLEACIDA
jgi:hypothetical protein